MRHLSTAIFLIAALPAMAQETSPILGLELNAVETSQAGCRLTFVVENGFETALDTAVFETVLFTTEGVVERLTLFDMQSLPAARMRVRQFDIPDLACDSLGRVLINGVHACSGAGIDQAACEAAIVPASRLENIEVIG